MRYYYYVSVWCQFATVQCTPVTSSVNIHNTWFVQATLYTMYNVHTEQLVNMYRSSQLPILLHTEDCTGQ